jgi:hypothetical protein
MAVYSVLLHVSQGARLLMDFVQELVSNFGHMATMKCKTCLEYKPFKDYDAMASGPQEAPLQEV